jgi:plasmid stabilization system protein ParE
VPHSDQTYEVVFERAATAELHEIFNYVEDRAGPAIATNFVNKLYDFCRRLQHAPECGTKRDELRAGLRTIGYRRRATILFEVDDQRHRVIIVGIYYGGRNYEADFDDENT